MSYRIVDYFTKEEVFPKNLVFTGEKSPWEVLVDLSEVKAKWSHEAFKALSPCLSKYLPLLPIQDKKGLFFLQEGPTPLLKSRFIGPKLNVELYFKLEGKNPTGSFKDRGSMIDVAIAKERLAKGVILTSTGNMAASCACYAAFAKIPCYILVAADIPSPKLAQMTAYGAKILRVNGSYFEATALAERIAEAFGFMLAGDYAFRVEGQKTAVFELIDQLKGRALDAIILPTGCGTNLAAYAKGLKEYKELEQIKELPALIGVQAAGANPIVQSFQEGLKTVRPLEKIKTIASAIAIGNPIDGTKALDALYATKGSAISVTDEEILEAQLELASQEGLFVETSSAATLAALKKCAEKLEGKKIVCILTGDGLKDFEHLLSSKKEIPLIDPNLDAFKLHYEKENV